MRIISSYLIKEVAANVFVVMIALLAMLSFFDLISELEDLGKGSYSFGHALLFVLLSMPGHIYSVMPVAVLVGCMLTFGQFARHSELIILRVSGISIFKLASRMLLVGLIFTLLTFFVGELITPVSEKFAKRMRIQATQSVIAQEFRSGLWVKDGTHFVNVKSVLADSTLEDINIYRFDDHNKLEMISHAEKASFKDDNWQLNKVTNTFFLPNRIALSKHEDSKWQSLIRPELLNILLVLPEKMSAWSLYSYIDHLKSNKQKTTRYEIALWAKIIYPLACFVMVILALPFSFLQQRATGASTKIFFGLMLGVIYQLLNRVFGHLGLLNDWPPLISAITPTLIFMIFGIGMLYWAERR